MRSSTRVSAERDDALLSRREALAAAGALGLGTGALGLLGCGGDGGAATGDARACVLTPEQTQGPYYVDDRLVRADITEGRPGLPLQLALTVQEAGSCAAIPGATVEVWHCDAGGVYSGFTAVGAGGGPPRGGGRPPGAPPPSGGPPPGAPPSEPATDRERRPADRTRFLRGAQRSDPAGRVGFRTIYPGWYQGRTPHIHVMVHVGDDRVHTGQLYFDDRVTAAVHRRPPYAAHGQPTTVNRTDGIFAEGGERSMLALARAGGGYMGRLGLAVRA